MSISVPRIKKLDQRLINRIAAGEVVERPASALKELLENSIDAKATNITVILVEGGIKAIKVIDDGVGVYKDDIPLTLDRHATSKLNSEDDLYCIKTLGFRGEGLASIASVSDFSLSSKTASDQHGHIIKCNYGEVSQVIPHAQNSGSIVEVNGLYHNIPARKKFLKSENTEYSHCKSVFERIALSYPQVGFELKHNDKTIYQLPAQTLLKRLEQMFGNEYSSNYLEVLENQRDGLSLSGYIYHPSYLSNNKLLQQFYINGRYVRDKVVQNGIKQGFSGVIHHEHQPHYALFLEINPEEIDVNVHPTKSEVRFRDSSRLHGFITSVVRKALSQSRLLPIDPIGSICSTDSTNPINNTHSGEDLYSDNPPVAHFASNQGFQTGYSGANKSYVGRNDHNQYSYASLNPNVNHNLDLQEHNYLHSSVMSSELNPPLGFALAQVHGIYIISQTSDGVVIVDMHAAHERIILERLKRQFAELNIASQALLLPEQIDLDSDLYEVATSNKNSLERLGFGVQCVPSSLKIIIDAIPALLGNINVAALILDVLKEINNYGGSNKIEECREEILSTMSCHNAVRANHCLSIAEMNALLREIETTIHGSYCNHGRPTWSKLSLRDLDNMFMRGK